MTVKDVSLEIDLQSSCSEFRDPNSAFLYNAGAICYAESMTSNVQASKTTGLLISGGLDSAILLGHLLEQGTRVQPIYVATGCVWQEAEQRALKRLLESLDNDAIDPVVELEIPLADLYGQHWSMTGHNVPDESTSDEAVFLLGRNPLLLVKAMLWCSIHGISRLALAALKDNPFADATPRFFQQFEQSLCTATGSEVEILRPFDEMSKKEVLAIGADLPLYLTFSCIAPQDGQHCGVCNKCAERARGLRSLPGGDPTSYASNHELIASIS